MASDMNRGETSDNNVQHVFIIGSKSIGQYGGYETFVDSLIGEHEKEPSIKALATEATACPRTPSNCLLITLTSQRT